MAGEWNEPKAQENEAREGTGTAELAPKIKLCGLRRVEDVEFVLVTRPDYAGVILAEGFKRTVSEDFAADAHDRLMEKVPLVGVFLDDAPDRIVRLFRSGIIDIAQLHGNESAEDIEYIQKKTNNPVWKVWKITEDGVQNGLLDKIKTCPADMVLLDAGTGSGESFDWSLTQGVERPFILAGGLTPDNVGAAIAQTHPFAVDTSSGVETDGVKDLEKMLDFCRNARKEHPWNLQTEDLEYTVASIFQRP